MMIAACGVYKRSQINNVHDYPVVTKKEFDYLLAKLKEKETSLTLDSILLPATKTNKDAGKHVNAMI